MKYQIPYKELELIGLTKQTIDSMPNNVKERLGNGELTPLLVVKREIANNPLGWPVKLQLTKDSDDSVSLRVYPFQKDMANTANLSEKDFLKLLKGDVVYAEGKYFQRDPEVNGILEMQRRDLEIDRKIANLEKVRDIELGTQQKTQIKEGKPVELDVGGEKVTVGVDLRDKDHFKSLNGDMYEWKRQQEIIYDILHPEFVGIVQTDENRWEQQIIKKEGLNTQTLKERPAQTRTSGMRM